MREGERVVLILTLVFVAIGAWLGWLLLWYSYPTSHLILMLTLVLALGSTIAVVTLFVGIRKRLFIAVSELTGRIRRSPRRIGDALAQLVDNDTSRATLGLVCIAVGMLGIAASVTSLTLGRDYFATARWGAAAVAGNLASWYLIARRRRSAPQAPRVENLTSQLVFNTEDQEDPRRIDFLTIHRLRLTVTPAHQTKHWRLGLEFSQTQTFSGWRYGVGHPLWHLTKNAGDPRLLVTYYNELIRPSGDEVAIAPYDRSTVEVNIERREGMLEFRVSGNPGHTLLLPLEFHKVGRLFAWADGKQYELTVSIILD